jgi:NAD(P)-dependent dehydrogenase (short-subunit alcohol dehydrogenase family)
MYSSSVVSSVVATHLAARFLKKAGLLILPGAAACSRATPWALTYGSMKSAVHHMVHSLGAAGNGLPESAVAVGIAPVMLDTPANRAAMPDADTTSWTPVDAVADHVFGWCSGEIAAPQTGLVYKIVSDNSKKTTQFIAM